MSLCEALVREHDEHRPGARTLCLNSLVACCHLEAALVAWMLNIRSGDARRRRWR